MEPGCAVVVIVVAVVAVEVEPAEEFDTDSFEADQTTKDNSCLTPSCPYQLELLADQYCAQRVVVQKE